MHLTHQEEPMPIKHSAVKELRKDRKRRQRNQAVRSKLKTLTKQLLAALAAKRLEEASALVRDVAKQYNHAASKGIIHPNTAARHTSRAMRRLHQLRAA